MAERKTQIADIDRSIYDVKNAPDAAFQTLGLNGDIIREISKEKNEPEWMLEFRLKSLDVYNQLDLPPWGPDISEVNLDNIVSYIKPKAGLSSSWEEVPEDIKNTFDRLGIPEAEKQSLAGVGAQYDSEVVYHSIQAELEKQGVVYITMEQAVRDYPELVKAHFMKCVTPREHKFAALHGAIWSGGSFVHVPEGVEVAMPLQSYFRLNAPGAGQFEHTLIILEKGSKLHFIEGCSAPKYSVINLHAGCVELFVGDGASLRYSTIENWSKNMYNLNTKKSIIGKGSKMEWVSGSFGSKVSMLYPQTVLQGDNSTMEFTGVTFAAAGQCLDTGAKAVHVGKNTSSTINTKSVSKSGGAAVFRSAVRIGEKADNSKSTVSCESLMLDNISRSDTIPAIDVHNSLVDLGHEAKIGRISEDAIFYLMSRGIKETDAKAMIVRGFAEPVAKELPLEYAVEMNNLINLEFEGAIG
ncbi:MAG: Fe-S cluster assembly protein SufB [Oscillospiraceae bacterium]|jgi:Fe-S cluster assembly protein SufB|nr:Fe-S cluster assembly protein SufB [Oscillospiraceae bacterium]